jgi:hypothetical protein
MGVHFGPDDLRLLNNVEEIEIEIEPVKDPETRRVIWIVIAGGEAYVRSVKSMQGHWYQELIAKKVGTIFVDGRRIPVNAIPVSDSAVQVQVDVAYRRKYPQYPDDIARLLSSEVHQTTLRLEPAVGE